MPRSDLQVGRTSVLVGKAMIVTTSRGICSSLIDENTKLRPEWDLLGGSVGTLR